MVFSVRLKSIQYAGVLGRREGRRGRRDTDDVPLSVERMPSIFPLPYLIMMPVPFFAHVEDEEGGSEHLEVQCPEVVFKRRLATSPHLLFNR